MDINSYYDVACNELEFLDFNMKHIDEVRSLLEYSYIGNMIESSPKAVIRHRFEAFNFF